MRVNSRLEKLKGKDWTPILIFALPLAFLAMFMFWPSSLL